MMNDSAESVHFLGTWIWDHNRGRKKKLQKGNIEYLTGLKNWFDCNIICLEATDAYYEEVWTLIYMYSIIQL